MTVVKLNRNVSFDEALQNPDLSWEALGLFVFLSIRESSPTVEELVALNRGADEAMLHRAIDDLTRAGYITLE